MSATDVDSGSALIDSIYGALAVAFYGTTAVNGQHGSVQRNKLTHQYQNQGPMVAEPWLPQKEVPPTVQIFCRFSADAEEKNAALILPRFSRK